MKTFKKVFIIAVLLTVSAITAVTAQVTIGADSVPSSFSVLELISNGNKGLRLPQVTYGTVADSLSLVAQLQAKPSQALGLQIFNMKTQCVETWNGLDWIAQCAPPLPPPPAPTAFAQQLCTGSLISDLSVSGENGAIFKWYSAESGGAALVASTVLTAGTYWVSQTNSYGKESPRTSVTVALGDCSVAPANGNITTFTNVMYDFQHQTLEAYNSDGIATAFQWQYSTTTADANFVNITDAPNSPFYTIPADFARNHNHLTGSTHSVPLYFRCLLSNPNTSTPVKTTNMEILFINTSTSGYGTDANGVKYIKLRSANTTLTPANELRIALLNLGQDNNDAGDLGDFYQWGRVPDGHQRVSWSKNASHDNQIAPYDGVGTSELIARPATTANGNYSGWSNDKGANFGQLTDADLIGKFVTRNTSNNDWSSVTDNTRWGNGSNTRTGSQSAAKTANDPCPTGWKIPSRHQFWDIFNGNGSNDPSAFSGTWTNPGTGTDNNWIWRAGANNAVGGALITNPSGEILFVPTLGLHNGSDGSLIEVGRVGLYWSSTYWYTEEAYALIFDSGRVSSGNFDTLKVIGTCIRCVAE